MLEVPTCERPVLCAIVAAAPSNLEEHFQANLQLFNFLNVVYF